MILKFDGWPSKTIGHLFYATSSFVWLLANSNWSYSPEMLNLGQNLHFFVTCDLEIWRMTLNNKAPLLGYFKLCAWFHSHWWTQTGVIVWTRSIQVKIRNHFIAIGKFKLELQPGKAQLIFFCPVWKLTDDNEKQSGTSYMPLQALCIIS